MAERILDGIKVLDLSRVLAGPWCTQILADFGADVIKIEAPGKGDDTRAWGPPYLKLPDGQEDRAESAYYLSCNRNKRSAAINLATPEGAELIRRLAAAARRRGDGRSFHRHVRDGEHAGGAPPCGAHWGGPADRPLAA